MCYYDLYIYQGCGHGLRADLPVAECPEQRKVLPDGQSTRTPSLTHSVSTRASRRTTGDSLPEQEITDFASDDQATEDNASRAQENTEAKEPCSKIQWHAFHTRLSLGNCPGCSRAAQARLSALLASIAEDQTNQGGETQTREKPLWKPVTITRSKTPRPLLLVARHEVEMAAKAQTAAAEAPLPASPSTTTFHDARSTYAATFNDAASTVSYMKELWTRSKKKPESVLSAEVMSIADTAENMSPVEPSDLSKGF
jgi:hypothetical protein